VNRLGLGAREAARAWEQRGCGICSKAGSSLLAWGGSHGGAEPPLPLFPIRAEEGVELWVLAALPQLSPQTGLGWGSSGGGGCLLLNLPHALGSGVSNTHKTHPCDHPTATLTTGTRAKGFQNWNQQEFWHLAQQPPVSAEPKAREEEAVWW